MFKYALLLTVAAALLTVGCLNMKPKLPVVVLETSEGVMKIELFPDVAPVTVQTILNLVNEGFYDSLRFHRVIEGFMIQTGDPTSAGREQPEFTIQNEANDSLHRQGSVAMARRSDPNSASTQFYICVGAKDRLAYLDKMKYTVFGRIIEGMDVALKISQQPTSGSRERIGQDSLWRQKLLEMKQSGEADVILAGTDFPMPDRPLKPIYIIRAYEAE